MNRLTVFKEEVEKWVNQFGLKEYKMEVAYGADVETVPAWVCINLPARMARFFLNDHECPSETEESIRCSAFHEVCELLLYEYCECVVKKHDDDDAARHAVIRRLENGIFRMDDGLPGQERTMER